MENAVKALLMAAGVLIGVLVLSLGATLYSSLSSYTDEVHENLEQNALDKFNAQFTGYVRDDLTIQDIVTVANIAYENNIKYDVDVLNENSYYVQVILKDDAGERAIENVIKEQASELLETNLGNTFECTNKDTQFSTVTGRIMSIKFEKNRD